MRNSKGQFVKGCKFSEEIKRKMSKSRMGRIVTKETRRKIGLANSIALKGKHPTEETRKKLSEANKGVKNSFFGKTHTKKAREKISKSLMGHIPWNKGIKTGIKPWLGKKRPNVSEENNYNWKGNNVGYIGVHAWIVRQKGKASEYKCEHCDKQAKHWANKKHDYKRVLDDYMALCVSCHRKYDKEHNGYKLFGRN